MSLGLKTSIINKGNNRYSFNLLFSSANQSISDLSTSDNEENNLKYIAVLDFEATCDSKDSGSGWNQSFPEIIEFPIALINIEKNEVIDIFHSFVRPTIQPKMTDFCSIWGRGRAGGSPPE